MATVSNSQRGIARFQVIPARNTGGYLWRFLSGNNRTIAISVERFDSPAVALSAIESVRHTIPQIKRRSPGAYSWNVGGVTTRIMPLRDVEKSARTFRAAAPSAPVWIMRSPAGTGSNWKAERVP